MVKIRGLGGEFGIPKDQIQTILKPGQTQQRGLSLSDLETSASPAPTTPQKPSPTPPQVSTQPPASGETKPAANEEETKEYQQRLAEVTQKLEAAKQDYLNATQGGGSSSNVTKEGFQGWIADIGSRIRDSQKVPGGGGPQSTPPTPPIGPTYTPREKQLSDLRIQVDSLQKERDNLIQEMKSKNIPTGVP